MVDDPKDGGTKPDPFQLEPEQVVAKPIPPMPVDTEATQAALQGPPTLAKVVGKDGEERIVSTQTLRERKDPNARTRSGPVPLPPGWPREALSYPVRDRLTFLTVVGAWAAVDTLGALSTVLGWILGILAYAFAARWQLRAVARSATGDDVAPDPASVPTEDIVGGAPSTRFGAPALTYERVRRPLVFLLYLLPAAVPFLAPYLRSPSNPVRTGGETALMVATVAAALLVVAPAFLLAAAFDDRELEKPWVAARWFLRGPLAFVAVAVGWAVVLVGSLAVGAASSSVVATLFASLAARAASVYALLVAARLLGVLGRRYEP